MLTNDLFSLLVRCLIITIIVEVTLAYILKYRGHDIVNVLLVNILTNPLLNFIIVFIDYRYGLVYRNIALLVLEGIVLICEGYIYEKYLDNRKINCYCLSVILNSASLIIGIVINSLWY